jgi:Asp-tRNA(Asn)/Glu-tRNA(Gln) amidotransferase A subunit family amidase
MRGRDLPAHLRAVYRNGRASLVGHPAVSVLCGFGMGDTLSIGLMLHGRPLEEAQLYRVAYVYEQDTE